MVVVVVVTNGKRYTLNIALLEVSGEEENKGKKERNVVKGRWGVLDLEEVVKQQFVGS